jgi:hypothetical protein
MVVHKSLDSKTLRLWPRFVFYTFSTDAALFHEQERLRMDSWSNVSNLLRKAKNAKSED